MNFVKFFVVNSSAHHCQPGQESYCYKGTDPGIIVIREKDVVPQQAQQQQHKLKKILKHSHCSHISFTMLTSSQVWGGGVQWKNEAIIFKVDLRKNRKTYFYKSNSMILVNIFFNKNHWNL